MNTFDSLKILKQTINNTGYIVDNDLVMAIYLSYHLEKPLLLEGPAGVGKTEIALVLSQIMHSELIRLQAYEGIDDSKAIYEWNYKKQLLYIDANKDNTDWANMQTDIYSEEFLSDRPILKSIRSDKKTVLLIDEIDKSDEEFEPLLLEILSAFQVSIPEIGTIKAKQKPFVILTSNNIRELSDALKRRCCYFYLDYPSVKRELEIVHSKVNNIDDLLGTQLVYFVDSLRNENLKKAPSISETIDWARAIVKLEANTLTPKLVKSTLNLLLKYKADIDLIDNKVNSIISKLPNQAIKINKTPKSSINNVIEINNNDSDWDF